MEERPAPTGTSAGTPGRRSALLEEVNYRASFQTREDAQGQPLQCLASLFMPCLRNVPHFWASPQPPTAGGRADLPRQRDFMPLPFISQSRICRDSSQGGPACERPTGSEYPGGNKLSREAAPNKEHGINPSDKQREAGSGHVAGYAVVAWTNAVIAVLNR